MRIYELVIEPGREEHIARHQVSVTEVEEVIFGAPFIRKARQGRYHIIGQTEAGRYLAVFVAPRGSGVYGLVTARDADDAERRAYLRQSDDSPRLQGGGFWNDSGMSSHTDRSFQPQKRDKLKATSVSVGTC